MATRINAETSSEAQEKKLIAEIEKKHGKTVDQLREEREKRVRDAIQLRVPDRVPVNVGAGIFAARYAGLTASVMYYDSAAYRAACKKMLLDFEPDNGGAVGLGRLGKLLDIMEAKQYRWPGGNEPPDGTYQFLEGEYMKVSEYDHFLSNPCDFIIRFYLPRTYGALEPLAKLPAFKRKFDTKETAAFIGMLYFRGNFRALTSILTELNLPELHGVLEKLNRVEQEQMEVGKESVAFSAEMARLGFPGGGAVPGSGGSGSNFAPFDEISDYLRGMRGTMLDMHRIPDKLLTACDKILNWEMGAAVPARPDAKGNPVRVGMPLHRGSDGFMSVKDFEKFYWPTLKKAIEIKIKLGYTVSPFFEGIWDQRLEYLLDFPKGKVIFQCEKTDIFKAKEILGGHMCIQGGVPPTILQTGSIQDVEEHCKKLIKVAGKGGGFILSAGSSIEGAKPANIKAMVDSANKFGWY